MKKINVKSYNIKMVTSEGIKEVPYDVVTSIRNVVLASGQATNQQLSMVDLLRNSKVLDKLEANIDKKGFVLLEDSDYNIIKKSFNLFKLFGINEVELCKRIEEAETVDVKEVKK